MATNKIPDSGETALEVVPSKSATSGAPRQVSSRCSNVSSSTTTTVNEGETAPVKKIPPIKAPVGLAKGPDLKNCKSKIGSLNNIKHTPASSGVTIPSQKLNWTAKSKVGSLDNKEHKPGGGVLKVESRKLEWKAESKVQSLQNINHKPAGGKVKIFHETYMNKATTSPKSAQKESNKTDANNNGSSGNKGPQQEASLVKDLKGLKI